MNKKFRVRRYVRQFLQENRSKKLVQLDISTLSDSQTTVAVRMMHKLIVNSRKNNQSVSIKTH
ncbi:hypothetical protein J2Z52_001696 [Enterococcus rivorum]|uniref:Uncharacterized protein n=1 Tax=Enterococcus rivorum TaxID=762845 RepID=A0A1E5L0G7_9ENTE|nr:hypothetical protein [Enterococcus rivorum]OEH83608.1 hypothetical protein BCR26_09015 [Enterococcus rivorum]